MPLPRREKTAYNDIRQPNTEQVPHIPSLPEGPVCIKQSVKEYRDRVMPDWFQKVTEEADKCQKLKRGRARYAKDGSGPSGLPHKEKSKGSAVPGALLCHQCRGQGAAGGLYRGPLLSCYYREYARDAGVCQSFVPLLHTMRLSETLRVPQLTAPWNRRPPSLAPARCLIR
ncbi:uncharacterized protein LOC144107237 [Amblyomma americanum]